MKKKSLAAEPSVQRPTAISLVSVSLFQTPGIASFMFYSVEPHYVQCRTLLSHTTETILYNDEKLLLRM